MTKQVIKITKIGAVLLLLSFSSNSFASNYHSGSSAYKYLPIGIAIGYLAHKSYSHKVHHNRSYGNHYRGYNRHYSGRRYYGNRYSNKRSYGNKRYYSGKRYHGNRYHGRRSYGYKRYY